MSSGPENKFRKSLVAALTGHFGRTVYIQKNHGSAFSAGLVDMEVVLLGKVGFYELKASDGPFNPQCVTALQRVTLEAIEAAGGRAYVLHYNTASRTVGRYGARSPPGPNPNPGAWGPLTMVLEDPALLRLVLDLQGGVDVG